MVKTKVRSAGDSHAGRVRSNNEDAFYIDGDRGIYLVVDGIGGQAAGEQAAAIAVSRVRARLERQTGTVEQRVREAITMANNAILSAARSTPEWEGMACVLTLVVLENGSAVVGHVGDSRLYQVRGGKIRKITHDHSPVGEREDAQEISEADAMRHPRRNEVYRDVGSEEHQPDDQNFIELQRIPFEPDSALVLCSDGLSDQVPSEEIRRIVERGADRLESAASELIEAANRVGGKDNVTVVVAAGEEFRPPASRETVRTERGRFGLAALMFVAGLLLASGAAWVSRGLWAPAPVKLEPRVIAAGQGVTIGQALAEARAGDTVEVASGEYGEAVRLKSGVSVRSKVPRGAILRAGVTAENVKGASLTGFRIAPDPQAPLPQGILLVDSEVELSDNEIQGAGVGIEVRGGASPVLRGNAIRDSAGAGLLISGPSQPWISHNTFQGNKGPALAARDGARPALMGNLFDKNTPDLPADIREHNYVMDSKAGKKK